MGETGELPPLPQVAARALALTRDPRVRMQDIVRVVGSDGAFAAQVLRISRSATYLGRRRAPQTLGDAITTIGFESVRQILIVAAARSSFILHWQKFYN